MQINLSQACSSILLHKATPTAHPSCSAQSCQGFPCLVLCADKVTYWPAHVAFWELMCFAALFPPFLACVLLLHTKNAWVNNRPHPVWIRHFWKIRKLLSLPSLPVCLPFCFLWVCSCLEDAQINTLSATPYLSGSPVKYPAMKLCTVENTIRHEHSYGSIERSLAGLGQSGIIHDSCRCWGFHFPPSLLPQPRPFVTAKYSYFRNIIPLLVLAVSHLAFLQMKPNVPTQSLASVGIVRSRIFIVHPQIFRCKAEHDCQGIAFVEDAKGR